MRPVGRRPVPPRAVPPTPTRIPRNPVAIEVSDDGQRRIILSQKSLQYHDRAAVLKQQVKNLDAALGIGGGGVKKNVKNLDQFSFQVCFLVFGKKKFPIFKIYWNF